jgi:hypothetical protein
LHQKKSSSVKKSENFAGIITYMRVNGGRRHTGRFYNQLQKFSTPELLNFCIVVKMMAV